MKRQRDRATANQFDQAVLEQITHTRGMNVPVNAISSAVTFCVLVGNRLYGERTHDKRSTEFNNAFKQLVEDARVARAQYELKAREQQEQASRRRIIVPGGSN